MTFVSFCFLPSSLRWESPPSAAPSLACQAYGVLSFPSVSCIPTKQSLLPKSLLVENFFTLTLTYTNLLWMCSLSTVFLFDDTKVRAFTHRNIIILREIIKNDKIHDLYQWLCAYTWRICFRCARTHRHFCPFFRRRELELPRRKVELPHRTVGYSVRK